MERTNKVSAAVSDEELEAIKAAARASEVDQSMSELLRRVVFAEVCRISSKLDKEEQDAA